MSKANSLVVFLVIFFMQGCASLNTYHNRDVLNPAKPGTTSVDAKQRFLLYAQDPNNPGRLVYCAEPSPDAFSAFSASLDASAKKAEVLTAAFKATSSESAGTIGIRTQSIQLLRDAMYRSCEGYLAGALTPGQYSVLQSSYQKSMVTLVAIEQLTQAVRPGQVILNAASSLTASQGAVALKKDIDSSGDRLSALKANAEKAEKARGAFASGLKGKVTDDSGKNPADEKTAIALCEKGSTQDACKKYLSLVEVSKAATKSVANEIKLKSGLQQEFDSASNDPNLASTASGSVNFNVTPPQQSPEISKDVVNAVKSLVSMVYMDEFLASCAVKKAELERTVASIEKLQSKAESAQKELAALSSGQDEKDAASLAALAIEMKTASPAVQYDLFAAQNITLAQATTTERVKLPDIVIGYKTKKTKERIATLESSCQKVLNAYADALAGK